MSLASKEARKGRGLVALKIPALLECSGNFVSSRNLIYGPKSISFRGIYVYVNILYIRIYIYIICIFEVSDTVSRDMGERARACGCDFEPLFDAGHRPCPRAPRTLLVLAARQRSSVVDCATGCLPCFCVQGLRPKAFDVLGRQVIAQ